MLNFGLSNLNLSSIVGPQSFILGHQQNPLLIGEMSPMFPTNNQGLQDAAEWGALLMNKQKLINRVNYLAVSESRIQLCLKSEQLDESQKQRLQDTLDQIKALKEKAQKMLEKQDLKSEEIEAILGEIDELIDNASKLSKEITEELEAAEADGAGDAGDADGTDAADAADDADGADGSDDDTTAAEAAEAKKNEKAKKNLAYAMEKICDRIDGAVREPGTNYDDDENGIKNILKNEINKDNVLELFAAWDRTYKGQGCYDGKVFGVALPSSDDVAYGLIGTLMNDCEGSQKEEIALLLINALADKAHELGIDVSKEVTKAKLAAHGSNYLVCTYRDDDDICEAVNALYEKVKQGVQSHEDKVKADAANKKAEKAQAEAKKVQDQKNRFRDAMRYALDDDKAEMSSDVRYENNKFVITIHGEDYYGKNYKELANALEKDGLDPAQYLKQKSLNAVA